MSAVQALQALLRKCDETLGTIVSDDLGEVAELYQLRQQIAAAVGEADAAQADLLAGQQHAEQAVAEVIAHPGWPKRYEPLLVPLPGLKALPAGTKLYADLAPVQRQPISAIEVQRAYMAAGTDSTNGPNNFVEGLRFAERFHAIAGAVVAVDETPDHEAEAQAANALIDALRGTIIRETARADSLHALGMDYAILCGELSKGLSPLDPEWLELRDLGARLDAEDASCAPPAAPSLIVPDNAVHLIHFDDADRRPELFAAEGARAAANERFRQVSASWNAHLFVKLRSNSRDDRFANDNAIVAPPAPQPVNQELLAVLGKAAVKLSCACVHSPELEAWEVYQEVCAAMKKLQESAPPAAPVPQPLTFDLLAHARRHMEFSARTFGPGTRTAGVVDHIRKELREIEAAPLDLEEWIDVWMLSLDGAWRTGASPEQIVAQILAKQAKNEGRRWPDWRTADPDKAIEHDRSLDR